MSSDTIPTVDLVAARTRNEEVWRRSSALLFAGDIDSFITYWCEDGRYEAALPVPGLPPVLTGHGELHAAFTGSSPAPAASPFTTSGSTRPTIPRSRSSRSAWWPNSSPATGTRIGSPSA